MSGLHIYLGCSSQYPGFLGLTFHFLSNQIPFQFQSPRPLNSYAHFRPQSQNAAVPEKLWVGLLKSFPSICAISAIPVGGKCLQRWNGSCTYVNWLSFSPLLHSAALQQQTWQGKATHLFSKSFFLHFFPNSFLSLYFPWILIYVQRCWKWPGTTRGWSGLSASLRIRDVIMWSSHWSTLSSLIWSVWWYACHNSKSDSVCGVRLFSLQNSAEKVRKSRWQNFPTKVPKS